MGEKLELLKSSKEGIALIAYELESKPDMAKEIIKFMNGRTKEWLKDLDINDKTSIIIDAKKLLTKIRKSKNDESRLHEIIGEVASFKNIFKDLIILGFENPRREVETSSHKRDIQSFLEFKRNDDNMV
jgi:hypothetical protein